MTLREETPASTITAAELMARLANDPEFQQRKQAAEAERQVHVQELRRAEQPIVRDLHEAGFEVESVWDLVNTSVPYPAALPVLLKHLTSGGYPDRVMEGLASALAVRPASFAWETFRQLYMSAQGRGEEEGLAVALAASTTADHLDEMIALLGESGRSNTRIHLLRAIKRVGGDRGLEVLRGLREDPMFGPEARALLKSKR